MRPDEERSGPRPGSRPDNHSPDASIATWAEVYTDAERWVAWTARRRWPKFAVNDQIWASSVTSWELHGRRSAA